MKSNQHLSMPALRRPRNPLVAPSLKRKAGAHRASAGGERQRDAQGLRREVLLLQTPAPPRRRTRP